MRNLKKLLAVIITVAMLASMMVPALAADYDADAQKLYDLGLFKGTSDSSFQPDLEATLIRETGLALMIRAAGLEGEVEAMTEEEVTEQLAKIVDADEIADWAKPYAAYAVANGLTNGIDASILPNVKFGAKLDLSGKEFVAFMLKAMGYDVSGAEYANVLTKAADVGMLSAGQAVTFGTTAVLTRDGAVGILAGAMGGTTSAGITLAEALVDAGAVSEDAMVDAGYMAPLATPTPVALTAEAYTDNLIQINVVFSQEVDKDSAEDEGNYEIDDVTIDGASLQDDGVTVVLTLAYDDAQDQQSKVELAIDGVKSLDGIEIDDEVVEVEFFDTDIPTAVSASIVGNDTFKVVFSEPIDGDKSGDDYLLDKKDFVVNGGKTYVKKVKLQNNYTEALVEMYSKFKEGDITLQIKSGSEDFAGFGVIGKTFDLEVEPDEEAPEVIGYEKAKVHEVTLIWNEDIEFNGNLNFRNAVAKDTDRELFYHTNSKNPVRQETTDSSGDIDKYAVKVDGNKTTLYFDDDTKLPAGTAYVYVAKEAVRDLWDNENTQQMIQIEVELDETPPEVDKIEVEKENKIVITFTEELDEDSAEKEDNYTILDEDGDEVKNIIDEATYSSKKVTIDFDENLNGDYSIVIEDVEDTAGNEIVPVTVDFFVGDETAPKTEKFKATVYNAKDKDQMVKVDFDDIMTDEGKYSVTDISKYEIIDLSLPTDDEHRRTALEDIDDVEIILSEDGKYVEIFIPSEEDADDDADEYDGYYNFEFDSTPDDDYEILIGRVADAADNKMAGLTATIPVVKSDTIEIKKVEATAVDTIEVTFGDKLEAFEAEDIVISASNTTAYDHSNYKIDSDILEIAGVSTEDNDDGNTVAVFTLAEDLDYDLNYDFSTDESQAYVHVILTDSEATETESANRYGKTLRLYSAAAGDSAPVPVKDKVLPELYDDGTSGDSKDVGDYLNYAVDNTAGTVTFSVYFTEEMKSTDYDPNYDYAGADFAIYYDHGDDVLVNGSDYSITSITGNIVTIEVDVTKLVDGKDVTGGKQYKDKADFEIELAAKQNYLTDIAGNKPDSEEFGTIEIEKVSFDCTK